MTDYVDLHCHWVWQIDDGARTESEGLEMLSLLAQAGFRHVVATPHMRPGMFDNSPAQLIEAYLRTDGARGSRSDLPHTSLGSEHFFDSDVVARIHDGSALPYREGAVPEATPRSGGGILVEFADLTPLPVIERQLFDLQTRGFIPVIAHPERYRNVWTEPERLVRLVELGSVALLDVSALVGKYGRHAEGAAWDLLEREAYGAACTDSHRPSDVEWAEKGMARLAEEYGEDELIYLMSEGPRALLMGKRPPP